MKTGLVRQKLAFDPSDPDTDLDLANRAAEELGYTRLLSESEGGVSGQRLAIVLDKLDIKPFSRESVYRFKRERAWAEKDLWDNCLGAIFLGFAISCLVAMLDCLTLSIIAMFYDLSVLWPVGMSLVFFAFCIGSTVVFHKMKDRQIKWVSTWIEDYDAPIPHLALETACLIKQAIPSAKFAVEQLHSKMELKPYCLLSLVLNNKNCFHLDVWGEMKKEKNTEQYSARENPRH